MRLTKKQAHEKIYVEVLNPNRFINEVYFEFFENRTNIIGKIVQYQNYHL